MKTFIAAVLFLAAVSFLGTAQAKSDGFPASGKYTIADGFNGTFKVIKVDKTNRTVTVEIPTIPSQLEKEGIVDPHWQMSASHCWHNNGSWILATEDADSGYALSTQNKDGNLLTTTKPLKENSRFAWYRFWGQDTKSGKWLWINQADAHNRNDAQGNPGYELMVDYQTGVAKAVPGTYENRK